VPLEFAYCLTRYPPFRDHAVANMTGTRCARTTRQCWSWATSSCGRIVEELVELMRRETTVDWRHREPARAAMRVKIKHLLRKHGYPPDKEKKAVELVIEQAELFADEMTAA